MIGMVQMITEKLNVFEKDYGLCIDTAAQILKRGGIVAIPTETVYGLAASAFDDEAIKAVFAAKGRPQDNPLIVHISDMEMLNTVACDIPKEAYLCAESFWPGPFTMVLKKKEGIANSVSAGLDTVAVRMPSDKFAHDVIEKSKLPLAAPSANTSGAPSPTSAYHVINDLDGKIDAVLIGNDCEVGVESTVVALFGEKPRLLRPGAVTVEQLRKVLPDLVVDDAVLKEPKANEKVASPGMKYKHYSPKTETYLVEGSSQQFADFVNKKENCSAICFEEDTALLKVKYIPYGTEKDERTLAKNIFSALREIDGYGSVATYVHAPSKTGVGLAVYNRLIRAAAFKVIKL